MGQLKKSITAAIVAGLFLGGAGVAAADSWRELEMRSAGVFFQGDYKWEPKFVHRGGFHVVGDLKDADSDDGHNVYLRAKVEAYDWTRVKGVQKKTVHVDHVFFDGAMLETNQAKIQACRDRGSLRPDNCSKLREFLR
ncbi:hypothetical protein [Streptomyces roseolus]|uniref:hypothetical protein n=1 Tax=Streptomyces roseolus TaxID=67358 RepID=UPI0019BC8FCC|nr:hypothetical protein [Streptomyces roseolus]GGR42387.1 hypothetical protein GCM10010282_39000 [Streptomyces roseolus]